jgi:hypothetical protein
MLSTLWIFESTRLPPRSILPSLRCRVNSTKFFSLNHSRYTETPNQCRKHRENLLLIYAIRKPNSSVLRLSAVQSVYGFHNLSAYDFLVHPNMPFSRVLKKPVEPHPDTGRFRDTPRQVTGDCSTTFHIFLQHHVMRNRPELFCDKLRHLFISFGRNFSIHSDALRSFFYFWDLWSPPS